MSLISGDCISAVCDCDCRAHDCPVKLQVQTVNDATGPAPAPITYTSITTGNPQLDTQKVVDAGMDATFDAFPVLAERVADLVGRMFSRT